MKIKRKSVRADGKLFWAYKYKNGEKIPVWISPEMFERWDAVRRNYAKRKYAKYLEQQKNLPEEQRLHRGKFDPITGLYFIRVSTVGKPVWGSKQKLEKYISQNQKAKIAYYNRCTKLEAPSVCLGDPHPSIPGLVVRRIYGHKLFYGTVEQAQKHALSRMESYKRYKAKNKELIKKRSAENRKLKMENLRNNPHLMRKRGDVDPILGKIFWEYNYLGNPIWLDKKHFEEKHAKTKLKRKLCRLKRKEAKDDRGSISGKNN